MAGSRVRPRGTRRESIHGGSCAAVLAAHGPAKPHPGPALTLPRPFFRKPSVGRTAERRVRAAGSVAARGIVRGRREGRALVGASFRCRRGRLGRRGSRLGWGRWHGRHPGGDRRCYRGPWRGNGGLRRRAGAPRLAPAPIRLLLALTLARACVRDQRSAQAAILQARSPGLIAGRLPLSVRRRGEEGQRSGKARHPRHVSQHPSDPPHRPNAGAGSISGEGRRQGRAFAQARGALPPAGIRQRPGRHGGRAGSGAPPPGSQRTPSGGHG